MHILFDARHIVLNHTGLARYTSSVLESLLANPNLFRRLTLIVDESQVPSGNSSDQRLIPSVPLGDHSKGIEVHHVDAPLFSVKHHLRVSRLVNASKADLYFYPHFDLPLFVHKPAIFVVHDLKHLVLDDCVKRYASLKRRYFRNCIRWSLRKPMATCIAVSESTRRDLIERFGENHAEKIRVSYEGLTSLPAPERPTGLPWDLPENYLLYVGDRRPHKNLKKMIDVFRLMHSCYGYIGHFILAGNRSNFDFDVDRYIDGMDNVHHIGPVSDAHLSYLYSQMDALFFMSKYEGFGLPVLEAASYNKKIVTSDCSSLPEVAPDTALLIDPDRDSRALAKDICAYLDSSQIIRNEQHVNRFSWDMTVSDIFGEYC